MMDKKYRLDCVERAFKVLLFQIDCAPAGKTIKRRLSDARTETSYVTDPVSGDLKKARKMVKDAMKIAIAHIKAND